MARTAAHARAAAVPRVAAGCWLARASAPLATRGALLPLP